MKNSVLGINCCTAGVGKLWPACWIQPTCAYWNHYHNFYGYKFCCCCSTYLSSCLRTASNANLLDEPHTFHYQDYFVIGGIHTCLRVFDDPMFLWISLNSCPLNLLLVRSHQAEIIIVKRLIQGRSNVTRVRVEPRSFDQGCCKNNTFTHSAMLPTRLKVGMKITNREEHHSAVLFLWFLTWFYSLYV